MSQKVRACAVILYPTLGPAARESRIAICDPVHGDNRAYVVLRPVDMLLLEGLITKPASPQRDAEMAQLAHFWAFGPGK